MTDFIQAVGYVVLLLLMVGGPLLVIGIWYLANSNPIPPIRGLRSRVERVEHERDEAGLCSDYAAPAEHPEHPRAHIAGHGGGL